MKYCLFGVSERVTSSHPLTVTRNLAFENENPDRHQWLIRIFYFFERYQFGGGAGDEATALSGLLISSIMVAAERAM